MVFIFVCFCSVLNEAAPLCLVRIKYKGQCLFEDLEFDVSCGGLNFA